MLTPAEALITLNLIPGLGSIRIQSLLEFFGTAELVLNASPHLLEKVPRIGSGLAAAIADWQNCTNVRAEQESAAQYGVRIITLLDDAYPAILRRMTDPPIVLYVKGGWDTDDFSRSVAIVGTRHASAYGRGITRRMARELAEAGCTIISGMARGIDTEAHTGALEAGGRTIAVMGRGLADIYPPENRELADKICAGHGALVSEFPMHMRPAQNTFLQRNRIVAAWSRALLVTEAPQRSGSLHTAGLAADNYGNSVFAVPGNVTQISSAGCHELIRDGAILCTSSQELLSDMGWSSIPHQLPLFDTPAPQPRKKRLKEPLIPTDEDTRNLIAAIRAGHDTLDALCSALGQNAAHLNPLLMRLQIQGIISPRPGGRYHAG